MKIAKFYLFLATISCLSQLFTVQQTLFAAVPVQIRVNVNTLTNNQVAKQAQLLKQLQILFKKNQVHAGFWFSGPAYLQLKSHDPKLVQQIFEDGFVIAHHGANRGSKGNSPVDKIAGMDWDTAVAWVLNYEQRPAEGGLSRLQKDFNGKIHVTGRFFRAPILQATKQLGCEAMIGLKGQLNAPSNAAWYMGMFNLPDRVTITPDEIRRSTLNPDALYERIDKSVRQWPDQTIETITIVVHDYDFTRGSSSDQQKFWASYRDIISWISTHPNLETVTYDDLIKKIIDDRQPLLDSSTLFSAVQYLLKLDEIPLYISVNDIHLSMADLFYSLSASLMTYHSVGKLPTKVKVENLLGPVVVRNGDRPVLVTSKEILSSIASWLQPKKNRVPASLQVDEVNANSAALLFVMAEIYNNLYQGKGLPHQVQLRTVSMFPAHTGDCPDKLSRLQFWTYKPQRPAVKIAKTKAVNTIGTPVAAQKNETPIYVTVYSHNEEDGPWARLLAEPDLYKQYRSNLIKKIKLIHKYGAALSWQSDHAVLRAMLKHEKGNLLNNTNNKNILRWMAEDMGVEIVPHGHLTRYNYADISYLIKKLGVTPSAVLGGFALYSCNKNNQSITERNWQEDLEIRPDGAITGRYYPAFTWKPKILVLPAMIGHVFDEFSSGVWQTDTTGKFTEHDANGYFTVIGQGYPHYVENLGHRHAGGAMVRSSSLGYIKELAKKIRTTPEMQGSIYTASIHIRDYPTKFQVDTYEGLKKTLEEIAPLVATHRVIFMNYEDIASLWQQKYHGISNRYPIDESSLFHMLQQDLRKQCQEIAAGKQSHSMNLDKCGDGICDAQEQRTGFCKRDCQFANKLKTNKETNGINHNLCGDGICDTHEQRTGMCKIDCSSQETSGRNNQPGLINSHLCGDGICDENEKRNGMCPQDCK